MHRCAARGRRPMNLGYAMVSVAYFEEVQDMKAKEIVM